MKRAISIFALFAITCTISLKASPLASDPTADMSKAKWENFNKSLVRALATDHKGLQQAAMRLAIQYSENTNIDEAVFDVVRIYRNSDDEGMRRMAVTTLGKMNNKWGIDFLARSLAFEKSPCIQKQIRLVLADYYGAELAKSK